MEFGYQMSYGRFQNGSNRVKLLQLVQQRINMTSV